MNIESFYKITEDLEYFTNYILGESDSNCQSIKEINLSLLYRGGRLLAACGLVFVIAKSISEIVQSKYSFFSASLEFGFGVVMHDAYVVSDETMSLLPRVFEANREHQEKLLQGTVKQGYFKPNTELLIQSTILRHIWSMLL